MLTENFIIKTFTSGIVRPSTIISRLTTMDTAISGAAIRSATVKVRAHNSVTWSNNSLDNPPVPMASTLYDC